MRILVAEDDPVLLRLLTVLLGRWDYDVVAVDNGVDALTALLGPHPPRLALLDWMMPGMDGVDVVRRVREANVEPYVYAILLTSRAQRDDVIQGLDAGADDYLVKPVHQGELRVRIRAAQRLIDLHAQLIRAREELRTQALRDPLTGLANRRAVIDALQAEAERARRGSFPITAILLDLDHFKHVNDTWGHLVGDEVLRQSAERIRAAVRAYDVVGRYGGEEFLVVAPGCAGESALGLAERVRQGFAAAPIDAMGARVEQTASVGVATLHPHQEGSLEELLREADEALYAAKYAGRNRVVVGHRLPRVEAR